MKNWFNRKKPVPASIPSSASDADFKAVIEALEHAIKRNWRVAIAVFIAAILMAIATFIFLPHLTNDSARTIEENKDNIPLAIFILLRATAFAGVLVAMLYGLLNLARAALDQATRYQKRLMAAHFMHYVFDGYPARIGQPGFTIREVVEAIDAWSRNVESAYTKVRFGKPSPENWSFTLPDGTRIVSGSGTDHTQPAKKQS